ncbi:GNAT family N-acetyltransferase [Indiicoccus explosivorum]|uniref:GNAT family N-acetyltransferase n=1 Tax=Indiicoccus explosivorum TaxID=1917864 RepID=UPI000B43AE2C|nr:GNAT family N-acetyltransferase [Indiicoccus explosivorum]
MMQIKQLSDCTVTEGTDAWNKGFEGYFFDMTMTEEAFSSRMTQEDLDPALSVVAFRDGEPAGLVLNGIRETGGRKVGWNGGTGVASSARGTGIGRRMMERSLELLREAGAEVATLEAISGNEPAIALYEKTGYRIIDRLQFLHLNGKIGAESETPADGRTEIKSPEEASRLPFYRADYPWQTMWQSAKGGEAIIAKNDAGTPVGYVVYRKVTDSGGKHIATVVLQCEADPAYGEGLAVIRRLLNEAFDGYAGDIRRVAVNVPVNRSPLTHEALKERGFELTSEQVDMRKELI